VAPQPIPSVDLTRGSIGQYDCVVIATEHKAFDEAALVAEADLIVDTWNAIKEVHPHVFGLGKPKPGNREAPIAAARTR
jgi:UDP-N-acetyl-D-glucosamine dehydrogenase